MSEAGICWKFISAWEGDYEGTCELPKDHAGDHFDGVSWFNDDGEFTDDQH